MKKLWFWVMITLILVFAAGVVGGVFAERWWFVKRPDMRRGGPANYPSMDSWAKELGLTAEQRAKIREIFKKNDERIKGLRTYFFKHLDVIRDELKKEIDAVLTPEQKQKLEAMIQKHLEERRKESEKREKRIDSRPSPNPKKESMHEKENDRRAGDPGGRRGSRPGLCPY
jgi:Spy/CpxP family protein refolding chaperone